MEGRTVACVDDRLPHRGHDRLGRDAELLEEAVIVGRRAVVLEGDRAAGVADQAVPAQRETSLDTDTRPDPARQDLLAIPVALLGEPLQAGR